MELHPKWIWHNDLWMERVDTIHIGIEHLSAVDKIEFICYDNIKTINYAYSTVAMKIRIKAIDSLIRKYKRI